MPAQNVIDKLFVVTVVLIMLAVIIHYYYQNQPQNFQSPVNTMQKDYTDSITASGHHTVDKSDTNTTLIGTTTIIKNDNIDVNSDSR